MSDSDDFAEGLRGLRRAMQQAGKMIIYNIFPLLAGRFAKWEPHLSRAAEMGFNWIFVNPIQRSGSSGSLYSLADYYSFNPLLVDQETEKSPYEQIQETIGTARRLGLKMVRVGGRGAGRPSILL